MTSTTPKIDTRVIACSAIDLNPSAVYRLVHEQTAEGYEMRGVSPLLDGAVFVFQRVGAATAPSGASEPELLDEGDRASVSELAGLLQDVWTDVKGGRIVAPPGSNRRLAAKLLARLRDQDLLAILHMLAEVA